jgi:hypothetical protein
VPSRDNVIFLIDAQSSMFQNADLNGAEVGLDSTCVIIVFVLSGGCLNLLLLTVPGAGI